MVSNFAQAFKKASEFSGYPSSFLSTNGFESEDRYFIPPADDAPEGTPGYFVSKDSDTVSKVTYFDFLNGADKWLEENQNNSVSIGDSI